MSVIGLDYLVGLSGRLAIDFEGTGLSPWADDPLGVGIWAPGLGKAGYVPIGRSDLPALIEVIATWAPGTWILAHNLKFELNILGLPQQLLDRFRWYDTQVAEHLLNEDYALDLGSVESRRLKTKTKRNLLADTVQWGGIKAVADWPVHVAAEYCINDCRITYEIAQAQTPLLKLQKLQPMVARMTEYTLNLHQIERRGMLLDKDRVDAMQAKIATMTKTGEDRFIALLAEYGLEPINYGSSQQLSHLLYQDLGLPWPEVPPELANSPKAGKYNSVRTDQSFLERMVHPVPQLVLLLKRIKTISGYLKSYVKLARTEAYGPVVHPSFNATGTVTGRLSCSKPNLQQVSTKTVGAQLDPEGHGLQLRSVFMARPGYTMVSVDYKQMEVVLFAMLSNEKAMLGMVRTGQDMHAQVARLMFGEYREDYRKVVKTLNFGLLYGLGTAGLAEQLRVSPEKAQALMAKYMSTFSVRPWMTEVANQLGAVGYVRYWSGRKRRIPDRRFHYRGVNALVQGGCSDILAEATNRVSAYLRQTGHGHIVALIHDEMLLEIRTDIVDEVMPEVRTLMAVSDLFGVPFNTDMETGLHWVEPGVKDSGPNAAIAP